MIHRLIRICGMFVSVVLGLAFVLGGLAGVLLRVAAHFSMRQPIPKSREVGIRAADVPQGTKRRILVALGGLLLAAASGGVLVVASGIIPIGASSGHWPITEWFLQFAMHRSVSTHSLGVQVPPLNDSDLILKGATHYEIGCRPCHGSPGMSQPRIPGRMTPHPPDLPQRIRDSKPQELFYVVKHGVKFTGMPAWPALQREDEVWAVVAFLQELAHLDEAGYRRLVNGDSPATAPIHTLGGLTSKPSAVTQSCARCHGEDGIGRGNGAFPKLAGQRQGYLENALLAYSHGARHSGIMEPISAGLTAATVSEVARYYARLASPNPPPPHSSDEAAIERGKAIARHGIPGQRVPSCIDCHAPEGGRYNANYPSLDAQHADYLLLQLELFKKGHRGGSPYAHLMEPVAKRLNPDQMRDVAIYFQSLRPPRTPTVETPKPEMSSN
ncbi:MAG TPA: c-type cytochrome [Terrimicrobiaceae bacterium]